MERRRFGHSSALILPQGKTLHVPDEPGCYTTLGPWRAQTGLSMVFFQATTKRDPELLLSFVTMGLLNANATGTYVTSLSLPLTNKRNVFEETPKYTKISDVAGFSDIDGSKMPWSQLLKPALKRQAMFLDMEAYNLAQVEAWVKAAPLAARIAKLKKRAITEIHAACADIAKQDKRAAEQRKAHMTAALDQSEANLWALPPSRYDRPLDERVRVLDAAAGVAQAEWLKTPQRADMQTGKAVCKPTALAVRRPAFAAAAPAAELRLPPPRPPPPRPQPPSRPKPLPLPLQFRSSPPSVWTTIRTTNGRSSLTRARASARARRPSGSTKLLPSPSPPPPPPSRWALIQTHTSSPPVHSVADAHFGKRAGAAGRLGQVAGAQGGGHQPPDQQALRPRWRVQHKRGEGRLCRQAARQGGGGGG